MLGSALVNQPGTENDRVVLRFSQIAIVFLLFFLSGVAALIYEISWTRQIGLLFGHTVHAASVVLASFFSGMAMGYLFGARWSSRINSLLGYAIAELIIAAWALLIPVVLTAFREPGLVNWLSHESTGLQLAIRAVFGFLLLLPATAAMGATLPLIAEHLSRGLAPREEKSGQGRAVALAYATNTFGAFVGACLTTFCLLVNVGVSRSGFLAAALSAVCAVIAFVVSRRAPVGVDRSPGSLEESAEAAQSTDAATSRSIAYLLAIVSGFGTLALQVLYLRMFSLVFHNSTYTFGLVVAVFIVALAIGAAVAGQLQKRFEPRMLASLAAGLGSVLATLSVFVFVKMTDLDYFSSGDTFVVYMLGAFWLIALITAPTVICLGMILPLTWQLVSNQWRTGKSVGVLTSVNTLSAAIGALVTSFVLLSFTGLWFAFVLISSVFAFTSWLIIVANKRVAFAGILGVAWITTSLLAFYSPTDSSHNHMENDERIVKRWNSAYGWIDLVERKNFGVFHIRQNLHYRFGTTGTNTREYRQAHIPLLLHEDPQDVLFLGMGTGLTAGGAVHHPGVKSIEVVELIPEVVEAAGLLSEYNFDVVNNPRVTVFVDDARHHLLARNSNYDVIVSDLFVPWESETGYLYTVEHYQVAASRLNPDGMFCQWLPLYQLGTREFELIIDSFASVFPSTTIWWAQLNTTYPVIALIGTQSPLHVDKERLGRQIEVVQARSGSTDPTFADPQRLLSLYLGDWDQRSGVALNTDEYPRVEFLTPVSNRDRKMIVGDELKRYYDQVLVQLPTEKVITNMDSTEDHLKRRALQRAILFGK